MAIERTLIDEFVAAHEALEQAEERLHGALRPIFNRIADRGDCMDVTSPYGDGILITPQSHVHGDTDYKLTAGDLASDDPAQAFIDRRDAKANEAQAKHARLDADRAANDTIHRVKSLSPEARERLLDALQS